MGDYTRVLTVENGRTVFIRNADGDSVFFDNLEDASRITGVDFTAKKNLFYEPEIDLSVDSEDPAVSIPHAPYEGLINGVSVLQDRQEDPFYGLTGPEVASKAPDYYYWEALAEQQKALVYLREHEDRVSRGLHGILTPSEVTDLEAFLLVAQAIMVAPPTSAGFSLPRCPAIANDIF